MEAEHNKKKVFEQNQQNQRLGTYFSFQFYNHSEVVGREREVKLVFFAEKYKCKPVLLRLSLVRNLENRLSMGPNGGSVAMNSGMPLSKK